MEGNRQRLDGGAMYGNVPRAMWETWTPPDERGRIELATRGFLIETGATKVLLETGVGAFFPPRLAERFGVSEREHRLLENLADLSLAAEDVDVVILSHLHFDHAGGLLSPYQEGQPPSLVFSRAEYWVSKGAWERARAPHIRDRASFIPELTSLLEASGRLRVLHESETRAPSLGSAWRFTHSEGHTPGMLLTRLEGAAATALFCADLVPGEPWVHLPVTMGYDRAPESLIDEKASLFAESPDAYLLFEHDPTAVTGQLTRSESVRFSLRNKESRLLRWDIDEESVPPRPESVQGI